MLAVILVMELALASVASAAGLSPFNGIWEADNIDDSHMRMVITGYVPGLKQRWIDDSWSICGGGANGLGKGIGVVDSGDLISYSSTGTSIAADHYGVR